MDQEKLSPLSAIPSIDRLLNEPSAKKLIERYGRTAVTNGFRDIVDKYRESISSKDEIPSVEDITRGAEVYFFETFSPSLKRVFNLTGTVLHTNLGRAPLPQEALEAVMSVSSGASNLEFDIRSGKRGDRDTHIENQLAKLTGAEAATVVNNNAAAVMLVLNSLAFRKEVPVSRGELVEIGGSFRIPEIMSRAGTKLVEVGTTNRTHLRDFERAIGPRTAMVMKVHTSNYAIEGFTASVSEKDLSKLCREQQIPFAVDLGSGSLIDLEKFGLPHEPTPAETMASGADLVTFSGDKLLGGPQAGIIVGRKEIIRKIRQNPMKRALRLDKMTIAALSAVLNLYRQPEKLLSRIPALRSLSRERPEIIAVGQRVSGIIAAWVGNSFSVEVVHCESQVGSGAMPTRRLPSGAISIRPLNQKRGAGTALKNLSERFRNLPIPIIGHIEGGALLLDMRCLEDEESFTGQLQVIS
jgi:L-seryl-tRNA(Ser) seleniumtransferase